MGTENQWNSDLVPHINFKNNFLLETKVISEWEKRRSKQVSNPLDLLKTTLLKNNAQPEKQNFIMKNGNKARDVLGDSQQRYRTLRTNQMARFVTVPFKKINKYLDQLTLSKLLRKDRGCAQHFSIDAKISHFTSLLFCRGGQENLSTRMHIDCFYLLNPLSHAFKAFYSLKRCNSWISFYKHSVSCLKPVQPVFSRTRLIQRLLNFLIGLSSLVPCRYNKWNQPNCFFTTMVL